MTIYGGNFDDNSAGRTWWRSLFIAPGKHSSQLQWMQPQFIWSSCTSDTPRSFKKIPGHSQQDNTAINGGGAILAYQNTTDISDCHFSNNMAMNDGGAVSAYTNLCLSEDSGFIYNTAGNDGGAMHAYELHTTTTQNTYMIAIKLEQGRSVVSLSR